MELYRSIKKTFILNYHYYLLELLKPTNLPQAKKWTVLHSQNPHFNIAIKPKLLDYFCKKNIFYVN